MMYKLIRVSIALSLVLGIVLLARDQVAWAAPVSIGDFDGHGHGTVKPPPRWLWVCKEGVYSLGGVSTLSVENLAPYYCIRAFLWKARWPPMHAPAGIGKILADITFVEIYYHNRFVKHLPVEDGKVELCYAAPPGKQAKIYFLDFYGKGKPRWTALNTTMKNGMACAPAQDSGAYALIGK